MKRTNFNSSVVVYILEKSHKCRQSDFFAISALQELNFGHSCQVLLHISHVIFFEACFIDANT